MSTPHPASVLDPTQGPSVIPAPLRVFDRNPLPSLTLELPHAEGAGLSDLGDATGRTPEELVLVAVRMLLHRERARVRALSVRLAEQHAPLLRRLGEDAGAGEDPVTDAAPATDAAPVTGERPAGSDEDAGEKDAGVAGADEDPGGERSAAPAAPPDAAPAGLDRPAVRHLTVTEVFDLTLSARPAPDGRPAQGRRVPLRERHLLISAVHRQRYRPYYRTLYEQAAALLDALLTNRPLRVGNEPMAWLAVATFLTANGTDLADVDREAAYALVMDVAAGRESEVSSIAARLRAL
ncbi:hypothetical protein [Streptomyces sp. NPDC001568]|uniref:hypothetical protein n=1 Tax=Streptomyces sp. NPDC001568 TaxID=3364588 RepID=UPI0036C9F928